MKEINFKVALTNEMEHLLFGEDKDFILYVIPTDSAPYKIHHLSEQEVQVEMAKVMSSAFRG